MRKTIFYNSNPVAISSKMNEYMKSNFGYEVEGDIESLREAKTKLEEKKREMRSDYQNHEYVETMLMIETIKSLLKAHVTEGELPPGLKAWQDKQKAKSSKTSKAKSDKMPMDAGKDGKMGTKDDKPAFLKKDESVNEAKDTHCSDKCCGADVKREDCECPPTCKHCNCNSVSEGKSPHKKGTKKYKAHMAAMHAEGKERTDEVLPLVPLVGIAARAVGGAVARKVGSKIAGAAANVATRVAGAKVINKNASATESNIPKVQKQDEFSNSFKGQKEYKMSTQKIQENLLAELNTLLESDAAEAEVLMAARGMVDELQDMIEKLGKLQNDQLGPLADEMAYSHGSEQSESFKDSVNDAIAGLLGQARATKDTVNNAVLVLNGEKPANDMTDSDVIGGDMQDDFEDDVELDSDDFAGGDEAASGPKEDPLGRAKR